MTHKSNFSSFGHPEQFEIAARWTTDIEPRSSLPEREGWSTADLRIVVGGQVLTANKFNGRAQNHLSWYLLPVIEWLMDNWTYLFHEENYGWPDKSGHSAAVATLIAMERTIGADDESGQKAYANVQAWWQRHAFRASDSSAIYPDVFFRRIDDDIEISWLARQPAYAPEGFALRLAPGSIRLPVEPVASAMWNFLEWATHPGSVGRDQDKDVVTYLQGKLDCLRRTPLSQLELTYINSRVRGIFESARREVGWELDISGMDSVPAIVALDSSVLMFGGLNVEISERDAIILMKALNRARNGKENPALTELLMDPTPSSWIAPHEEGYQLAADLRDDIGIDSDEIHVDIDSVVKNLDIEVTELALDTGTIRGVAIAGRGYSPTILINTSSIYNCNDVGKRFTLAHELCHILYDRTRAKKISHVSGPWASARIEKRANAFAVMFLASREALRIAFTTPSEEGVRYLAERVGLGTSALIEHLYNLDLIGDTERESLKQQYH
jgi:Zn-dependent peptidase ImmA (M78 family)